MMQTLLPLLNKTGVHCVRSSAGTSKVSRKGKFKHSLNSSVGSIRESRRILEKRRTGKSIGKVWECSSSSEGWMVGRDRQPSRDENTMEVGPGKDR